MKVRQSESAPTSRLVGVSRPTRTIIELPAGVTDCTTKAWYPSFTHDLRGRLRWQPTPGENSSPRAWWSRCRSRRVAQYPERMRLIGVLMPYAESDPGRATNLSALPQGLQQLFTQPYQPSPIWQSGRPAHRPFRGLLGVHSRYGLHTRAVTVYRDTLSEGFSHFVTSMTAPVASGWSGCRVGLAPTGKRRLFTAHARSRHKHRSKSEEPRRSIAKRKTAFEAVLSEIRIRRFDHPPQTQSARSPSAFDCVPSTRCRQARTTCARRTPSTPPWRSGLVSSFV